MKPLIAIVKAFEGLHKVKQDGLVYPYICPAGYATQGYGLLVPDLNAGAITPEEAERRMLAALPAYMVQAVRHAPGLLQMPEGVLYATTDFVFNLGVGRFIASTYRRKLNTGDIQGAKAELPKWVYGGGRVLPGLVRRAQARMALFPEG